MKKEERKKKKSFKNNERVEEKEKEERKKVKRDSNLHFPIEEVRNLLHQQKDVSEGNILDFGPS